MSENWKRWLMHLPVGAVPAAITAFNPLMGTVLFVATIVYEAFNDWRKCDSSYKDVLGIVYGYSIVAVAIIIWRAV